jgi:hypothetical protein
MTKAERLERLRGLRGTCYWPSWSRTPVDNWTAEARPDTLRRELGVVAGLGLNGVRLWTYVRGYEQDPATYMRNLTTALDLCAELDLMVDLVLFDSCGIDPELGSAEELPLEQAIEELGRSVLIEQFAARADSIDILEASALVEVPLRGGGIVAVWEGWTPSPGYYRLAGADLPRWEAFARDVVTAVRDHPALVLLEVMNEPFITHLGLEPVDTTPIRAFYTGMHRLIRDLAPDVPLTIGAENLEGFRDYEADLDEPLDVVSFHPLTYDPAAFAQLLSEASTFAAQTGRPALASEWGAFPGSHDEGQLTAYTDLVPVLLASDVAWCQSHLIAGYGPFALTAIVYANGTLRPAAEHLRRELRRTASRQ